MYILDYRSFRLNVNYLSLLTRCSKILLQLNYARDKKDLLYGKKVEERESEGARAHYLTNLWLSLPNHLTSKSPCPHQQNGNIN